MADTIKVLGQLEAAATTPEDLYTVPETAVTTTSSLTVCNRTGGALSFRLSVRVAGEGADNKQYLYYDKNVPANDTIALILGLTLGHTDVVTTYASATGLTFNLFGVETS